MSQKEWFEHIVLTQPCGSGTVYVSENSVLISYFMS